METMNIFEILNHNKIQQGGTIHQIAETATKTATCGFENGLLCYKFTIHGENPHRLVEFDGCVDGRLIAWIPDKHIKGYNVAVQVGSEQKRIIESRIFNSDKKECAI